MTTTGGILFGSLFSFSDYLSFGFGQVSPLLLYLISRPSLFSDKSSIFFEAKSPSPCLPDTAKFYGPANPASPASRFAAVRYGNPVVSGRMEGRWELGRNFEALTDTGWTTLISMGIEFRTKFIQVLTVSRGLVGLWSRNENLIMLLSENCFVAMLYTWKLNFMFQFLTVCG